MYLQDVFFSMLQFLWLLFHLLRLLLIVEPCHLTSIEVMSDFRDHMQSIWVYVFEFQARRTIVVVCEILRSCKDPAVAYNVRYLQHDLLTFGFFFQGYIYDTVFPKLKKFWRQLLADRGFYFSACGMCNIDRQILTSVSSAHYSPLLMTFNEFPHYNLQISGAIATYLVMLIQFQRTDG